MGVPAEKLEEVKATFKEAKTNAFSEHGPTAVQAPLLFRSPQQKKASANKSDNQKMQSSDFLKKRGFAQSFGEDAGDFLVMGLLDDPSPPKRMRKVPRATYVTFKQEPAGEDGEIKEPACGMATMEDIRNPAAAKTRVYGADMNSVAVESLAKGAAFIKKSADLGNAPVLATAPRWSTEILRKTRDDAIEALQGRNDLDAVEWHQKVLGAVKDKAKEFEDNDELRNLMGSVAQEDPNISAGLKKWPLMAAYEAEFKANPPLKDTGAVGAHKAFVQKAAELSAVVCRCCWGRGHVAAYCATHPRLKAASVDVAVTSWLRLAVSRPYLDLAADKAPADKLSLASLPYRLPEGYKDKRGQGKKNCLR